MLNVELGNPAKRFLKNCDYQLYARLMARIKELAGDPFPQEIKRVVSSHAKIFRVRVGDYRIQYVVFYAKNTLLITDVDKRSRAYS